MPTTAPVFFTALSFMMARRSISKEMMMAALARMVTPLPSGFGISSPPWTTRTPYHCHKGRHSLHFGGIDRIRVAERQSRHRSAYPTFSNPNAPAKLTEFRHNAS
jgi:hypothetical protein